MYNPGECKTKHEWPKNLPAHEKGHAKRFSYLAYDVAHEFVLRFVVLLRCSPKLPRPSSVQRQRLMIRRSVTEEQVFHEGLAVNFCGEGCARNVSATLPAACRNLK